MNYPDQLVLQIELHAVEGIRDIFARGVDPNLLFRGEPLINELTSEYTRGPRFRDCVRAFVDFGLVFPDQALLAVLLDDAPALEQALGEDPAIADKRFSLRCAYTPLFDASLLHICAEFNHVACARVLVDHGADVNTPAGRDKHGFGGQTPLYHTVNQNGNHSRDMMDFLLSKNADLAHTITGLIWGEGYDWETFIPSVNPISYCMMGLIPQMHRDERVISETVSLLIRHAYQVVYAPRNVPCAYLRH
jgi:hypothetical protein